MTGTGNRGWAAGALLLLIAVTTFAAWHAAPGRNWIWVVALLCAFILLLGKVSTGRALGILINERNLMSLSRFQMVVWTVLIVSAYFTIALTRVKSGDVADPLVIGVDWQVWALLGISTTSFVGTPLLNGNKQQKEPGKTVGEQQLVIDKTAAAFDENSADVNTNRQGILYGNSSINDARFTDLFEGDELANTSFIDVGKLQLFFFTVMVAITYGVQLYQLIAQDTLTDDVSLPTLNEGLLALLGVSHAGYLGSKGIDRTSSH